MSHLVSELSQTFDRVGILAPSPKLLTGLFEELALDLVTKLGQGQPLDMRAVAAPQGPLLSWTSFTLGKRGRLNARIAFAGMSFADAVSHPEALEAFDALFFWVPTEENESDGVFRIKVAAHLSKVPCYAAGLRDDGSLREAAIKEWLRRSFRRPQFLGEAGAFLREGLGEILAS